MVGTPIQTTLPSFAAGASGIFIISNVATPNTFSFYTYSTVAAGNIQAQAPASTTTSGGTFPTQSALTLSVTNFTVNNVPLAVGMTVPISTAFPSISPGGGIAIVQSIASGVSTFGFGVSQTTPSITVTGGTYTAGTATSVDVSNFTISSGPIIIGMTIPATTAGFSGAGYIVLTSIAGSTYTFQFKNSITTTGSSIPVGTVVSQPVDATTAASGSYNSGTGVSSINVSGASTTPIFVGMSVPVSAFSGATPGTGTAWISTFTNQTSYTVTFSTPQTFSSGNFVTQTFSAPVPTITGISSASSSGTTATITTGAVTAPGYINVGMTVPMSLFTFAAGSGAGYAYVSAVTTPTGTPNFVVTFSQSQTWTAIASSVTLGSGTPVIAGQIPSGITVSPPSSTVASGTYGAFASATTVAVTSASSITGIFLGMAVPVSTFSGATGGSAYISAVTNQTSYTVTFTSAQSGVTSGTALTVSAVSSSGGTNSTVTMTTSVAHNFITGSNITTFGTASTFGGTGLTVQQYGPITVISSTQFSFTTTQSLQSGAGTPNGTVYMSGSTFAGAAFGLPTAAITGISTGTGSGTTATINSGTVTAGGFVTVGMPVPMSLFTIASPTGYAYVSSVTTPTGTPNFVVTFSQSQTWTGIASSVTLSSANYIYISPYAYIVHRPLDGGVLLTPAQPAQGSAVVRQSKKVFRYQSGKGLLWSSGTLFCPNNDIISIAINGSNLRIVSDVPHGSPQAGAIIAIKGISTPGYNGSYTVATIIDSRTLEVTPAVLPTITPATLGDQPRFIMTNWYGASVRAGCFDDQNGLFWEWDGQNLWVVKRSSTFQLGGYASIQTGSQVVVGDTSDGSTATMNMGTGISTVNPLDITYPAINSALSITATVTNKTGYLNPGLLVPLTAFTGISPGAATVILSATYSAASGTSITVSNGTFQGPIVPGTSTNNSTSFPVSIFGMSGAGIAYVSSMGSQTGFTVTLPSTSNPANINGSRVSAGTALITTASAHFLAVGSSVLISGTSFIDGTFQVLTVPSSTTYTIAVAPTLVGAIIGIISLTLNPTTATITTASAHNFTAITSGTTSGFGTITSANGTFNLTPTSPTVLTYPLVTSPPSASAVYTLTGTFAPVTAYTPTSSNFSIVGSDVTTVTIGTCSISGKVVTVTSATGHSASIVVGLAVQGSIFASGSGIGYVTTVTSPTSPSAFVITFPNNVGSTAVSASAATFFAPVAVAVNNTLLARSQITIANSTGGTNINGTGIYVSPVGLSGTSFQYSLALAGTAVPTGGTITATPYLAQITTGIHNITSFSGNPSVAVTGGDASYALPVGSIFSVISPTIIQTQTTSAPTGTVPTGITVTYTATSTSAGIGNNANFIISGGLNLTTGSTLTTFAITPGTALAYTQQGSTVSITNSTTLSYVVNPSTDSAGSVSYGFSAVGNSGIAGGTLANLVTTIPSSQISKTNTGTWTAITNQTTLSLTNLSGSGLPLIAGASIPVAVFGGYGGYAYVAANPAPDSTTATVIFSQPQTIAGKTGYTGILSYTRPDVNKCDIGYATMTNQTYNTSASTGSFVASFVTPQTVAAGTTTAVSTVVVQQLLPYTVMPFVQDPLPVGTSNVTIVCTGSGLVQNMQGSLVTTFGSNVNVSYANTQSNAFVLSFPPITNTIAKSAITGLGAQTFVTPNTRFIDQLKVNDKVVIRGMTHTVVQIQSQGTMIVNPPYRGSTSLTVPVKLCKIKEVRTPQSMFNRDTLDGSGSSGFKFDQTKMQMIGLQYTWYGAGFVDFMMRGGDGNWVYAHRYKQNNINDEAYMRTGNMPVRYELINEMNSASSTLAAPISFTDSTLTLTDPTNYWPPKGNVIIDNECITYTSKSGNVLSGLVRTAGISYNVNDVATLCTSSLTAQQHQVGSGVMLADLTCTPSLTHWGSAFLMDGQFDSDRGYFFNYQVNNATQSLPGNATQNLFLLRLSPQVSNGIIGDMGTRDLLNRAQLLLQRLDLFATTAVVGQGSVVVSGILNPQGVGALAWTAINSVANGSQPSFAQVSSVTGNYISGSGERIFSTICNAGSQNSIDLSGLKEVCNGVIGGNGVFPDGPDTLLVQLNVPSGFPTITSYSVNLFWSEAQA
jgi:hypothetical protein